MVGYYLARLTGAKEDQAFRVAGMCRRAGLAPLVYSHNDAGFKDGLKPSSRVVASPRLWAGHDVLFLVRNPRDVLVSAYHHATSRSGHFSGSIAAFIRKPETGIAKVLAAYDRWHANLALARSFRIHSYEEMHRDPQAVLRSSLEFFGLPRVDADLLADAVAFCSLENMKRYEEQDLFKSKMMRNDGGSSQGAKAREGKVGSHVTVLSAEDRAFIDEYVARVGDPFAPYY
jgi:alcohol sulfotransferase